MNEKEANKILGDCNIGGRLYVRSDEEEAAYQRHLRRVKRKNK